MALTEAGRPPKTVAVRLTADGLRHVRSGHPWVFDRSVVKVPDDAVAGDLAVIFDDRRRFAAIGLYDPDSPIRVRVLHHGKPATVDTGFFVGRVSAADAVRTELPATGTTGYRLINGENDGFGGLVADRYDDVAVVKVYSDAWWPHLDSVVEGIAGLDWCSHVVLRLARNVSPPLVDGALADGRVLVGSVDEPVLFRENGLVFEAAVRSGQKTGHFCDQRDNRRRVGDLSLGRRVLDVFSHTGGFALAAGAGGATEVRAVDASGWALEALVRHWDLNSEALDGCRLVTTEGDAFETMAALRHRGERFGVVVVDPPSFAHRVDQVPRALAAYRRLTELALPLVEPGGWLVQASCSSRVTADEFESVVCGGVGRSLAVHEMTGHAIDHPVTFPQGAYLKAVFARLR